jgi:hypothetical protein
MNTVVVLSGSEWKVQQEMQLVLYVDAREFGFGGARLRPFGNLSILSDDHRKRPWCLYIHTVETLNKF